MKHSHLLTIQKESKLSPEAFAARLGVSNMTVRRWLDDCPKGELPAIYAEALVRTVYELISEGLLDHESSAAKAVLAQAKPLPSFGAAAKLLGVPGTVLSSPKDFNDTDLAETLSGIGRDETRARLVDKSWPRILSFKKFGKNWAERIVTIREAIFATTTSLRSRWVAYGSFFYLLCPLDMIADFTPVVGYLDDYVILGAAAGFLMRQTKGRD